MENGAQDPRGSAYPNSLQQPPKGPAASQVASPKPGPHRPSARGICAIPGELGVAELDGVPAHPLWQPLDAWQCAGVDPQ